MLWIKGTYKSTARTAPWRIAGKIDLTPPIGFQSPNIENLPYLILKISFICKGCNLKLQELMYSESDSIPTLQPKAGTSHQQWLWLTPWKATQSPETVRPDLFSLDTEVQAQVSLPVIQLCSPKCMGAKQLKTWAHHSLLPVSSALWLDHHSYKVKLQSLHFPCDGVPVTPKTPSKVQLDCQKWMQQPWYKQPLIGPVPKAELCQTLSYHAGNTSRASWEKSPNTLTSSLT